MVDKVALGQVFSEYFGFPCQSSFHKRFSIITITRGKVQQSHSATDVPSGPSLGSTPHYANKKISSSFT
jgi:hypothetical protein